MGISSVTSNFLAVPPPSARLMPHFCLTMPKRTDVHLRRRLGTDHPFFPPLEGEGEQWLSVTTNYGAIKKAFPENGEKSQAVLGGNAVRLLKLHV
jgi:hypothetical protein